MNPLYSMMMSGGMPGQTPRQTPQETAMGGTPFQNPIQRMNYILQAMQNPAQFVRQNLKGIPEQAFNDPTGNSVLQYMMNNMGVTQQDIQNAAYQIPRF